MAYALEDYLASYTKGSGSGGSRLIDQPLGRSEDDLSRWGMFVSQEGDCLLLTSRVTSPYLLPERYEADAWVNRLVGARKAGRMGVAISKDGVVHIDATGQDEDAIERWRAYGLGLMAATAAVAPAIAAGVFAGAAASRAVEKLIERRIERRRSELAAPAATSDPAARVLSGTALAPAPAQVVLKEAPSAGAASVSAVASRIAELSGLSDQQLANLFKVERETYCRWRTGALTNPRSGNRQRLALLQRLMEDLAQRGIPIKDWLLNSIAEEGKTAYELLEQGRIDRVAFLSLAVGGVPSAFGAREFRSAAEAEAAGELSFEDDNEWEYPADDEAEYSDDGDTG